MRPSFAQMGQMTVLLLATLRMKKASGSGSFSRDPGLGTTGEAGSRGNRSIAGQNQNHIMRLKPRGLSQAEPSSLLDQMVQRSGRIRPEPRYQAGLWT